jgi:hypothetical protein
MNCQSFENVVVDLARLTPLEASVRDAALAHVSCCDGCDRRLAQEKLLTGGLEALATEMKSAVAPNHLQQNLITVLRQQRLAPPQNNHSWRYLAVAAAIIVAVALGIVSYKMMQTAPVDSQAHSLPSTETPVPVASKPIRNSAAPPMVAMGIAGYQTSQAPPVEGSVETETSATVDSTTPINDSAGTPTRKQKPTQIAAKKQRLRKFRPDASTHSTFVSVVVGTVTDPEASEVMSAFMPLGDTNPANIQEGAQVVRVELPRYAMARFGLPVNMERYDERVKADVWLGADGLARAIRFVQ